MKIDLLKIEKFHNNQDGQALEFLPGGIQISDGNKVLANKKRFKMQMDGRKFENVTQDIEFYTYYGKSIVPIGEEKHSLINLLAVEGLVNEIYKNLEETK